MRVLVVRPAPALTNPDPNPDPDPDPNPNPNPNQTHRQGGRQRDGHRRAHSAGEVRRRQAGARGDARRAGLYLPISPYISPKSPYISLQAREAALAELASLKHRKPFHKNQVRAGHRLKGAISPISPYISPTSPHISPYLPMTRCARRRWRASRRPSSRTRSTRLGL